MKVESEKWKSRKWKVRSEKIILYDDDDCCGDKDDKDAHPLVRLLKGKNEGVHVSQVIFEEIHELVDIGLLKLTIIVYYSSLLFNHYYVFHEIIVLL